MQFENLNALLAMDGHGPFVWSAYAIALIVLVAIAWLPLARQRRFLREQQQMAQRRHARSQSPTTAKSQSLPS